MSAIADLEPLPVIDGIVYGEGPRWHNGRLWFTDGRAGHVCSAGETGDVAVEVEIERASGLGWLPDGSLVVSTLHEAKIHQVDTQRNTATAMDLSHLAWSTNDLLVAPDGRSYVDLYQLTRAGLAGEIGLSRGRRGCRRSDAGLPPASAAPAQSGANLSIISDPANGANYRVTVKGKFPMNEYDAHGFINNLGTGARPGGVDYGTIADDPDSNDRMIGSPTSTASRALARAAI